MKIIRPNDRHESTHQLKSHPIGISSLDLGAIFGHGPHQPFAVPFDVGKASFRIQARHIVGEEKACSPCADPRTGTALFFETHELEAIRSKDLRARAHAAALEYEVAGEHNHPFFEQSPAGISLCTIRFG